MSTITINGSPFNLPDVGSNPDWGEDLDAIIVALVASANSVNNSGDILDTSFSVGNNVSGATPITGLTFDSSTVRSALINYSVYRSTSSAAEGETGVILCHYDSAANLWQYSRESDNDAGLTFSISSAGQFSYQSSNMSGTAYNGLLKFTAKVFTQS